MNIIISIAVILISAALSAYTKFGLYVNAMSSNLTVAQNMGISVRKYQTLAFVYAGLCAGLMGIVNICYTTSASAASGLWPGRVDHSSTIWARGLTICAPRAKALIDVGVP